MDMLAIKSKSRKARKTKIRRDGIPTRRNARKYTLHDEQLTWRDQIVIHREKVRYIPKVLIK